MVKNFDLGTILTMTTNYKFVDDFNKVYELVWFVCDDNMIGPLGLGLIKDKVTKHLLTIHPELNNVRYKIGENVDEFILRQEEKFGSILPVTRLGEKLPEDYEVKTEGTSK